MNVNLSHILRRTSVLAGAMLSLASVSLFAQDTAASGKTTLTSDNFPTFDSYIKITGQAASITGDKTAFQERMRLPKNGGGGIEDLHYTISQPKDTTVLIDGRALVGAEDYLAQIRVTRSEVGSFELGFKSFRTFYDGIGGFFPLNKQWMPLANQNLNVDRRKFWVEGTIALPKMPSLTIRYTDETRKGQKDSTIWGDTDRTGLPFNLAPIPITPNRKIAPSYIQLNEHHKALEGIIKHTMGKTTLQLILLHDNTSNLDTRYVTRYPGEMVPWSIASLSNTAPAATGRSPQAIAKSNAPATSWNNQVVQAQSDGIATKTNAATLKVDTKFSDQVTFHAGGSYQMVKGTLSGERPLITSTDTSTGTQLVATATYAGLVGTSSVKVYTGNASIDWAVTKDFLASIGVRAENEFIHGHSTYNVLAASGTPAVTVASTPRSAYSNTVQHSTTPVIDLRYTGIDGLALYFDASKRSLGGDEDNTSAYNPLSPASRTVAVNKLDENHIDWKLGANWRVLSTLSLRAEMFEKHHKFESAGTYLQSDGAFDYYLLDGRFQGVKLTGTWKLLPELSVTGRVVKQHGKMAVTGFLPIYTAFDSCNAKNTNIGGSIDWTVSKSFYLQVNGTLVYNTINTIYPRAGGTPFTKNSSGTVTALGYDTSQVLQNSNNNYVTANVIMGFVAGKNTDLQAQYTYYRADNGDAYLAAMTQPYGAASRDSMITVGIKHKINDRMVLNAKVGYADAKSDLTGGFTNFRGPMAYLSLEHAL